MRWEISQDFTESDRELINQVAPKYEDLLEAQQKGNEGAIKTARGELIQSRESLLETMEAGALKKIDDEARRIVTSPVRMEKLKALAERLSRQLDARGIFGPS